MTKPAPPNKMPTNTDDEREARAREWLRRNENIHGEADRVMLYNCTVADLISRLTRFAGSTAEPMKKPVGYVAI